MVPESDVNPLEKSPLDIFSCSDDNYARHMGVLITSIRENQGSEKIRYWVISRGISETNKQKLKGLETEKLSIEFIEFSLDLSSLSSTVSKYSNINLSTYIRLFACELLPKYVDKVLYLDCDMVCRGSVQELFDIPFENNSVYGVRDPRMGENAHRLGLFKYVNAGMLFVDLKNWRAQNVQELFLKYLEHNLGNKAMLKCHDQDVINYVLADQIKYVDRKWNSLTGNGTHERSRKGNEYAKEGIILHLINKPWVSGNVNPFSYEYEKYLKLSPWSDEPVVCVKAKSGKFGWRVYSTMVRLAEKAENGPFWRYSAFIYKWGYNHGREFNILNLYDLCKVHGKLTPYILECLEAYSKGGNDLAYIRLARSYFHGYGVPTDYSKSFYWCKLCIDIDSDWVYDEIRTMLEKLLETNSLFNEVQMAEISSYLARINSAH